MAPVMEIHDRSVVSNVICGLSCVLCTRSCSRSLIMNNNEHWLQALLLYPKKLFSKVMAAQHCGLDEPSPEAQEQESLTLSSVLVMLILWYYITARKLSDKFFLSSRHHSL